MNLRELRIELLKLTNPNVANPDLDAWVNRASKLERDYVEKGGEQPATAPQQPVTTRPVVPELPVRNRRPA